jgi:hypothetical protein
VTRTQIQLRETQIRSLRQLSAEHGVSIADIVRQSVDLYLTTQSLGDRNERIERALKVIGKYSSGSNSGSTDHDAHLAEAFKS